MANQYGVINEIGDMGLGFQEVSVEEQKVIEESQKKIKKEKSNEER